MADSKPKTKRPGPNPPNILLTAVRRAVNAGVESAKIVIMLDMAISATKATGDDRPRQQADIFRRVAETLDEYSEEIRPAAPAAAQPAQEA